MAPDASAHDVLNVIIAARLSRKVGKFQGIGIETQDQYSQDWASRQRDLKTVHGVYRRVNVVATVPDVKSGRVAPWDRPNLRSWVTQPAKMAQYDAIIAYKNDRLSRGAFDDEVRIRQWASDNGKVLIIVDGPQWPSRDKGDFWGWTALADNAAAEWESIQERILRFQGAIRADGGLVGLAPFGYDIAGERYSKTLAPNETGRAYVTEIFQRIADGQSLLQVSAWLRSQGITGKRGAPFGTSAVHALIKNPVYRGQRMNGAGQVELEVEPLVDARLWKRANDRLANAPVGRRGPIKGTSALLTGALFCASCGSPMYRHPPRKRPGSNSHRAYYRCVGAWPERKGCGNMTEQSVTDVTVAQALGLSSDPWTEPRLIAGENHDIALAQIELDLENLPKRKLSDREEDAERARLRAERDTLESLPNVPDEWREVEICGACNGTEYTGACEAADHPKMTVGQHWASLDHDGKRTMLLEHVKIHAKPPSPELRKISNAPIIRIESHLFRQSVTWVNPSAAA